MNLIAKKQHNYKNMITMIRIYWKRINSVQKKQIRGGEIKDINRKIYISIKLTYEKKILKEKPRTDMRIREVRIHNVCKLKWWKPKR